MQIPFIETPRARRGDARLIDRLLSNDNAAWAGFLRRMDPLIVHSIGRAARRHRETLTPEDAHDIRAGFLLSLVRRDMKSLRSFDAARGVRFTTWISLLAERSAMDHLRAMRVRKLSRLFRWVELHDSDSPEDLCVAKEERTRVRASLASLRGRDRVLYQLYFEHDLPPVRVAEIMGTNVQTVYSKRHKIQLRVAHALAAHRTIKKAEGA